jgi:hypothetical protein
MKSIIIISESRHFKVRTPQLRNESTQSIIGDELGNDIREGGELAGSHQEIPLVFELQT